MLVVMSGLPGVGKSAIADALARQLRACVISVDPIEAAMLRSGFRQSFETGLAAYNVGAAVASHQLALGLPVVADAANYLEIGRQVWLSVAERAGVEAHAVEVICSDEEEHRRRLANRRRGLDPFVEPTWDSVVRRRSETEPWSRSRLVLDSVRPIEDNVARALELLTG